MSVGFSFLGLTIVAIIIFAAYTMKSRFNNSSPVVLSNYRTLKREDDKNMDVNEILSQYHVLHNGEHVTQELEVNSADYQGDERKEKIDMNYSITTDCTKVETKINENQTRVADSSGHNKEEKDANRNDKKLTSNESHYETINEAGVVSESLNRAHASIFKEDVIQESPSSLGPKKGSKTNMNVYMDYPILNSGEEHHMANQKPENGSPSDSKSVRTSQVQQNNEGTEVISEERNREEAD